MFSWHCTTGGCICIKGWEWIQKPNFWKWQLGRLWAAQALDAALVMFSLAEVINHWDICVLTFDLIVFNYSTSKWVDSVTKQPDIQWTDSINLLGDAPERAPWRNKTAFWCLLPSIHPSESMALHDRCNHACIKFNDIVCQGSMQLCVVFGYMNLPNLPSRWINIHGGKLNYGNLLSK